MDNIFTLIVIIVMILSVLGKLKPKEQAPKTVKSKRRPVWLAKLKAFLEEVQQSQSQSQRSTGPQEESNIGISQWRALMEKDTASIPPHDDREYDLGDLEFDDVSQPPKAKPASNAARARAGLPKREPEAPDPPAVPVVPQARLSTLPRSRADLRWAIVWSEILGPPVALKDPRSR